MGSDPPLPPFIQRGLFLCAVFQGKMRVCLLYFVKEGAEKGGQSEQVVCGPFISCDCPQSTPGWTLLREQNQHP